MTADALRAAVVHAGEPPAWLPPGADDIGPTALARVEGCDVAFVDAATVDALATARRLRAVDPRLQVIVVVADSARAQLERAITFTAGLGEIWLAAPADVDERLARRAAEVTAQRRSYRVTQPMLQRALAGAEPAPRTLLISDAYLAALLQVLPDPVFSIDEDGAILSWSPAAERTLRCDGGALSGRPLQDVLAARDVDALAALLERGRGGVVRGTVDWVRKDGAERAAAVMVSPVAVGRRHIRAVVLHDTTEQRRAQDQLEEQASELEAQTAELAAQTEELVAQRDQLTRLMQARSRFYASMSHEIRTPINAVLGYNDLLLGGVYGELPAAVQHVLERAQRAAQHLRELVDDVLDLSKIESGRIEILPEPISLSRLVEEVAGTIQPMAAEAGVELRCDTTNDAMVETDPRRARQILLNLLSNAIKFGAGRPVDIRAGRDGDERATVEVEDRGPGIAADKLDRIFEEFVQSEEGAARGGTGLGLAISKRLAALLGGELAVDSAPGQGSRFVLTLPLRAGQG